MLSDSSTSHWYLNEDDNERRPKGSSSPCLPLLLFFEDCESEHSVGDLKAEGLEEDTEKMEAVPVGECREDEGVEPLNGTYTLDT